jgi:hypothetical protein
MNLAKVDIHNFYSQFLSNIKGFSGIVKDEHGINTCTIMTDNADQTLNEIHSKFSFELNNFIEVELDLNPKLVNRNLIMFETENRANCLIIRW